MRTGLVVGVDIECPPENRLDAEHGEEIGGDQSGLGLADRNGPKERPVYPAKQRGRRAEPERERQDGVSAKPGCLVNSRAAKRTSRPRSLSRSSIVKFVLAMTDIGRLDEGEPTTVGLSRLTGP
jgi:hypothetical protein